MRKRIIQKHLVFLDLSVDSIGFPEIASISCLSDVLSSEMRNRGIQLGLIANIPWRRRIQDNMFCLIFCNSRTWLTEIENDDTDEVNDNPHNKHIRNL